MLKGWKKDLNFAIISEVNLIAKAQFRVLPSKKGIRLQENLTVLSQQAIVASLERVEKNPHVAIAKDVARWLNQTYSSAERGHPRC